MVGRCLIRSAGARGPWQIPSHNNELLIPKKREGQCHETCFIIFLQDITKAKSSAEFKGGLDIYMTDKTINCYTGQYTFFFFKKINSHVSVLNPFTRNAR